MNTNQMSAGLNFVRLAMLTLAVACGAAACTEPDPVTEKVDLESGLGVDPNEGWIVLTRPNSIWTVGTVIERLDNGTVRDIGTLKSLGCFPADAWLVEPGTAPGIAYGREIAYGLSVSATLGLPKAELAKAGLSFGGDGDTPSHKSSVLLNKVTEQRVDTLRAEEFLDSSFASMSPACQRNLLDAKRFIIDKILVVEDGELSFAEASGAKIDVSTPQYKFIKDAALKAGYSVTKDGSLKVPQGTPITFAVRQADFGSTLSRLGYERKGPGAEESLETVLVEAGAANPGGLEPFEVSSRRARTFRSRTSARTHSEDSQRDEMWHTAAMAQMVCPVVSAEARIGKRPESAGCGSWPPPEPMMSPGRAGPLSRGWSATRS